jgi:hypothetical protein
MAKQGHGDGFCGMYSLAHALGGYAKFNDDDWGSVRGAFRRLVIAADRLKLLDAYHVIDGFEDFELVEIFNLMAKNYRVSERAATIDGLGLKGSNIEVVRTIVNDGGRVVISVENGGHWVLAHKVHKDGSLGVKDSWPDNSRTSLQKVRTVEEGVAILPQESDLWKPSH